MLGNFPLLVIALISIWGLVKMFKSEAGSKNWLLGCTIVFYCISSFFLLIGYKLLPIKQNPDFVFPGLFCLFCSLILTVITIITGIKEKPHSPTA